MTPLVCVAPGIYQRKGPRGVSWWIQYRAPRVRGGKSTRVIQERLLHCSSVAQAQKARAVRVAELFTGQFRAASEDVALSEFLPRFLASRRGRKTVHKYQQQLTQRFAHLMDRPLASISRDELIDWYQRRLSEVRISTANNEIAALRALLNEARHRGIVRENPLDRFRLRPPNNARNRVLSDEEAFALQRAAAQRADFVRPLFFILYSVGCRLSEALTLTWDRIDLKNRWATLYDAKSGAMRVVPLSKQAADHLRWWKAQRQHKTFVFPNPKKTKPLIKVSKSWQSLCRTAGVDKLLRHDLRHNFESQLAMRGENDVLIRAISGHSTLSSQRRYGHARDWAKPKAIAKLPWSSHRAVAKKR